MNHGQEDPDAGQAGPDASWLTGLLDTEAGRYSPNDRRIRAAVDQRVRGGQHRALARVRPSRATAGIVTAVLAVAAAVAVTATVETRQAPAGLSPAAASGRAPLASLTPAVRPSGRADGGVPQSAAGGRPLPNPTPKPSSSAASPSPSPKARAGAGANLVSATGTNDLGAFPYWLQEEVSVSLRAPVTALQLTVTVARSAEVASTGYWTTDDPAVFNVTAAAQSNTLTYTFTLKSGQTLPAGSSVFAVQFNHGTNPHDPAGDTYALSVTSEEQDAGVQGQAAGGF